MDTMFQPFTRSVEADKMQISGTGLGLSVIKGLVDLMHGTIDVDSQKGRDLFSASPCPSPRNLIPRKTPPQMGKGD